MPAAAQFGAIQPPAQPPAPSTPFDPNSEFSGPSKGIFEGAPDPSLAAPAQEFGSPDFVADQQQAFQQSPFQQAPLQQSPFGQSAFEQPPAFGDNVPPQGEPQEAAPHRSLLGDAIPAAEPVQQPSIDPSELTRIAEMNRNRREQRLNTAAAEQEAAAAPVDPKFRGRSRPTHSLEPSLLERFGVMLAAILVLAGGSFFGWCQYQNYHSQQLVKDGMRLSASGKLTEALMCFDQAIALNPKNSGAYYMRGITYAKEKDLKKAMQDLTTAVNMDAKNLDFLDRRASVAIAAGQFDIAAQDYGAMIDATPAKFRTADLYTNRASTEVKLTQYQEALDDYRAAAKLDPKNKKIAASIAYCSEQLKHSDASKSAAKKPKGR
ncbi:MAG TPA: tetratricopeptide repeat protein [Planktothrix sp.]